MEEGSWAQSPTLVEKLLAFERWKPGERREERGRSVREDLGRVGGGNEYEHNTLYENLKESIKTLLKNKLEDKDVAQ